LAGGARQSSLAALAGMRERTGQCGEFARRSRTEFAARAASIAPGLAERASRWNLAAIVPQQDRDRARIAQFSGAVCSGVPVPSGPEAGGHEWRYEGPSDV